MTQIRSEIQKLLAYAFSIAGAINLFFGFLLVVNPLKIKYFIFYNEVIAHVEIFSPDLDQHFWCLSLIILAAAPYLCRVFSRFRFPKLIVLSHLVLLASSISFAFGLWNDVVLPVVAVGFAVLVLSVAYARRLFAMRWVNCMLLISTFVFSILVAVEVGSIAGNISNVFDPHYPFDASLMTVVIVKPVIVISSMLRWVIPKIELNISNIFYPTIVLFLIAFLSSWVWVPPSGFLYDRVRAKIKVLKASDSIDLEADAKRHLWLSPLIAKIAFLFSIVLGAFITYAPYIQKEYLVGVDTMWYYHRLNEMKHLELTPAVLSEPRSIYLLFLLLLKTVTSQDSGAVIRFAPILLTVFLSATVFLFVRVGSKNWHLAALSSIFSVLSINIFVGMFAGIYSSWLAMSVIMVFFTLFFLALDKRSKRYLFATVLVGFLLLFVHAWTWGILMGVLAAYVLLSFIRLCVRVLKDLKVRKELLFSSTIFFLSAVPVLGIFLFQRSFLYGASIGIYSGFIDVLNSMNVSYLLNARATLSFTLNWYTGSFFINSIIYFLAFLGMIAVRKQGNYFYHILFAWVAAASIACLLVDSWWQWRILYLMPFPILGALGVQLAVRKIKQFIQWLGGDDNYLFMFLRIFILLIILYSINYAVRCVNYLHFTS